MYTAVEINETDRAKLIEDLPKLTFGTLPDGWVTRAHHVTLNMGEPNLMLNPKIKEKDEIEMIIGGVLINWNVGIVALTVHDMCYRYKRNEQCHRVHVNSVNPHPHITMFHNIQTKPKQTNDLLKVSAARHWEGISGRLITGRVKVLGQEKFLEPLEPSEDLVALQKAFDVLGDDDEEESEEGKS